jgi:hypothetical protein
MCDGLVLVNLLEIIASKSVGRFNKHPRIRSQKIENNLLGLNFLNGLHLISSFFYHLTSFVAEQVKLVNIGAEGKNFEFFWVDHPQRYH